MRYVGALSVVFLLGGCIAQKEEPKPYTPPPQPKKEYTVLEKAWGGRYATNAYCVLIVVGQDGKRQITTCEVEDHVKDDRGWLVPALKQGSPCAALVGEKVML